MQKSLSYPPVGRCIYCRAVDQLTLEHIVPYSLGGVAKLPQASCRACAAITATFEGRLARTMYGNFRIRANFPTRRKADRPVKIKATDPSTGEHIWLDPDESIVSLPIVHFLPPGILREPPIEPVDWVGATLEVKEIMPAKPFDWTKLGRNELTFSQTFDVEALALTLAKIGHAYAVAEFGLDNFDPFLPSVILGNGAGIHSYVGGDVERLEDPGQLHSIRLRLGHPSHGSRADWLLMVSIGLMSKFGAPTSLVVVGRAKEEWARGEAKRRLPGEVSTLAK